jgi:hypothetical protein
VDADPDPEQSQQEDEERPERLVEDEVADGDAGTLLAPLRGRRRGLVEELLEAAPEQGSIHPASGRHAW